MTDQRDGTSPAVTCAEPECDEDAAVRLHVPWDENRLVCPACARSRGQQDGVVAEPLPGKEDRWP